MQAAAAASADNEEAGNIICLQRAEQLCDDAFKLLVTFPIPQEKEFDETVEVLLARLEDYCALLDLVRSESAHSLGVLLPQVLATTRQLDTVLLQVDRLDSLVRTVRKNVDALEAKVALAETELGQSTSLRNSIRTKLSSRSSLRRPEQRPAPQFRPPELASCDEFFPSVGTDGDTLPEAAS